MYNYTVVKLNFSTNNTYKRGTLRFLIFKKGKRYVGVCLDLDLVEEADTFKKAESGIFKLAKFHVETVIKKNLGKELLNRPAPEKYWKKLDEVRKNIFVSRRRSSASNRLKSETFNIMSVPMGDLAPA